jgi:V/A-type H+-transporting ATPase subunit I
MASAFNFIAATMSKAVPIVGFVFAAIILAWGHVITLLIGTLGAFVHTIRLQFVEFFSKFFRSTGKPFEPLAIENRFTVIEE